MKTNNFSKSEPLPDYMNERDVLGLIKSKKISMTGFKYLATNILAPNLDVVYAGLGIRTLATFIDLAIIAVLMIIPEMFVYSVKFNYLDYDSFRILIIIVFWIFYHTAFDSSDQGTPGKILLKLKVIDLYGKDLSIFRAMFRSLAVFISIIPIGLGIWYITTNPKKRSWHDLISGTFVIKS